MREFAEFERNIIRKRQPEGIAKAEAKSVSKNRKRKKKVLCNCVLHTHFLSYYITNITYFVT